MANTLPKICRLDKPASPDGFGIANSPIGFLLAAWQDEMLVRLALMPAHAEKDLPDNLPEYGLKTDLARNDKRAQVLVKTAIFPDQQWMGRAPADMVLGFHGTDFQQSIMIQMLKTRAGKPVSYAELATKAGYPGAARAAGSVCAKNPIPFLIPCHRILSSTGGMGGFLYGIALKRQLLDWEKRAA